MKWQRIVAFCAGVVVVPALFVGALVAEAQTEVERLQAQIEERNNELKNIEAEIAQFESALQEVGAEKDTLQRAINQLNLERQKVLADISYTENKQLANWILKSM